MEVYKGKKPGGFMKVEIDGLKEVLSDLLLPEDEVEELVGRIEAKGYSFDAEWLARYLLAKGLSRERIKELFRRLEVEDPVIAYIMRMATARAGDEPAVMIVGGGKKSRGDRLKAFQELEEEEDEEGVEEALRELYKAGRGGKRG
jgi:hypothetical protein